MITISGTRTKTIALFFGCLIFIIASYSALPFNHLFDDSHRYSPVTGYIVGIVGISFFGFGLISSIVQLVKPKILMRISDKGIFIPKGVGFTNKTFVFVEYN